MTSRELRERIAAALADHSRVAAPEDRATERAAVALILRPLEGRSASCLFVQRAERRGDPWSGHMALPGGRRSPEDADLAATALRETWEETGLDLRPEDLLGALDDIHPLSRHLPSISVTPFVAWYTGSPDVRANEEIRDAVWIPLEALSHPAHRSTLLREANGRAVAFPTIEYERYTIWGLTFEIVSRFLALLGSP